MAQREDFDKIELYLIRVLHTLITERNVSRAALRLQTTQPTVSAQLRRLRELTGDPLLVRAGNGMTPTATALKLMEPAAALLQAADALFSQRARPTAFDPMTSTALFRIAAADYLDPMFLPELVTHLQLVAPQVRLELLPLSGEFDYRRGLGEGEVDLVIGNWLQPPDELHLGRLMSDEIVCLVAADHPILRIAKTREWSIEKYLGCDHIAPSPFHPGAQGVIDDLLGSIGQKRELAVRSAHISLIPVMVARSRLVLTTGQLFCSRFVDSLPVRIVRCPAPFPAMTYYQLWHDRTHASASMRWFREQVREVARSVVTHGLPARKAATAIAPS
jgi:DNA-binding transcriptional LysR family regulator